MASVLDNAMAINLQWLYPIVTHCSESTADAVADMFARLDASEAEAGPYQNESLSNLNDTANWALIGKGVQGRVYAYKPDDASSSSGSGSEVVKCVRPSSGNVANSVQAVAGHPHLLADAWAKELIVSAMAQELVRAQVSPHFLSYRAALVVGQHWPEPKEPEQGMEKEHSVLIMMQRATGTCHEMLSTVAATDGNETLWHKKLIRLPPGRVAPCFAGFVLQLFQALEAMQARFKIIHQDLHLSNIFLSPSTLPSASWRYQVEWIERRNCASARFRRTWIEIPNDGYLVQLADWGLAATYGLPLLVRDSHLRAPEEFDASYDLLKLASSMWHQRKRLARVFPQQDIKRVLSQVACAFTAIVSPGANMAAEAFYDAHTSPFYKIRLSKDGKEHKSPCPHPAWSGVAGPMAIVHGCPDLVAFTRADPGNEEVPCLGRLTKADHRVGVDWS